ncbi:uncharacterized protein LOC123682725 [Harmonia axyridis]|uniref:uncharacterized protein LOC123682725 n=1 Tax=Harmonia axyridis TaxID=115357 RepID=UPI001E275686|nr:uncharacterized protein LOC123682725 [Harmonia axyridis]
MILRIVKTVFSLLMMHCHFVYSDPNIACHSNSSTFVGEKFLQTIFSQKGRSSEYHGIGNINFIFSEDHTVYDKVFWVSLITFVLYVVYIRAKTNFRIEYPDEIESQFLYGIVSFRKMIAPDPYLDSEMRDKDSMSQVSNGPIIVFWIIWYCLNFFSLDEVFGVTHKHIEDLTQLVIALFIYFINIVGCCIVFDICVSSPMKYYEK